MLSVALGFGFMYVISATRTLNVVADEQKIRHHCRLQDVPHTETCIARHDIRCRPTVYLDHVRPGHSLEMHLRNMLTFEPVSRAVSLLSPLQSLCSNLLCSDYSVKAHSVVSGKVIATHRIIAMKNEEMAPTKRTSGIACIPTQQCIWARAAMPPNQAAWSKVQSTQPMPNGAMAEVKSQAVPSRLFHRQKAPKQQC